MNILGIDFDINLENVSDLEKYYPIVEAYQKELIKTPLQEELTKINALKITDEQKTKKLNLISISDKLKSYRYQFETSKRFIAKITNNNEEIDNIIGENIVELLTACQEIVAEFNRQQENITQAVDNFKSL